MTTPRAYCSNPPPGPLISLLLIPSLFFLSFFFFIPLYISSLPFSDLSALAKKIKLEAIASYNSNQQHGGPNGENGDHNPGLGELLTTYMHCMSVTCLMTVV